MINKLSKITTTNLCTTAEHFQCEYVPGMHLKEGTTNQYAIHEDLKAISKGGTLTGCQISQVDSELSYYNRLGETYAIVPLRNKKGGFLIPHKPEQEVKMFYVPKIGDIKYDGSDERHPLLDLGGMVTVKRLGVVLLDDGAIGADDQIIGFQTKDGVSRIGFWGTGGCIAIHTAYSGKVGLFKEFNCNYMSDKLRVINNAPKNNNKAACLIYAVCEPGDTVEFTVHNSDTSKVFMEFKPLQIDGIIQSINARFFAYSKINGNGTVTFARSVIPNTGNVGGNPYAEQAAITKVSSYINLGTIGSNGECNGLELNENKEFAGNMLGIVCNADTTAAQMDISVTAKVVAS